MKQLILILTIILMPTLALAAPGDVTFPIGDWAAAALPVLGFVVLLLVIFLLYQALRFLPPWAQALVTPALVEQITVLANDAIEWGVQKAQDAVKGKEITVNIGSEVLAAAAQQAINTWPKALVERLGGIEGVKKEILKRFENAGVMLPPGSTADDILNHPAVTAVTTANPL
jgi:hypothetical protein